MPASSASGRPMSASTSSAHGSTPQSSTSAAASTSTLADLTACVRRSRGVEPPPMVGSSVTVIGDEVYVFGGRLIPTRTMVATLFVLSLRTLTWQKLWPTSDDTAVEGAQAEGPDPRYFHSAEAWGSKLVIWGGEGYAPITSAIDDAAGVPLRTLADLFIFDTTTRSWSAPQPTCAPGVDEPAPRYAHLSTLSSYRVPIDPAKEGAAAPRSRHRMRTLMVVMGGQDIRNTYIHEINVLDLEAMQWVKSTTWDRHIGTYRAIATSAKWSVTPTRQTPPTQLEQRGLGLGGMERRPSFPAPSSATAGRLGASSSGTSSRPVTPSPLAGTMEEKQRQAVRDTILTTPSSVGGAGSDSGLGLEEGQQLVQLSCSTRPSSSAPEPIFLYSNHNFTDVRRDLDMISVGEAPSGSSECELEFTSLSKQMTGPALPPGLRFPVGIVVGRHLLVFGTFLSNTVNNFSIWALDLGREGGAGVKSALDSSVSNGNTKQRDVLAWSRIDPGAVLSRGSWNRAVVWKNSVIILGDRERDIAQDYDHRQINFRHLLFCDLEAFGIYQPPVRQLSPTAQSFGLFSLSQASLADFEIICGDGKRLGCSRSLLEARWPWFRSQLADYKKKAKGMTTVQQRRLDAMVESDTETDGQGPKKSKAAAEMRLTPRTLSLPERSSVVQAFLQYIYTLSLCTPLQHSLPILTSLLMFSRTYDETCLRALVVHALHEALATGHWTAALIYEAATLGSCYALQLRSLKMMMNSTRSGPQRRGSEASSAPSPHDAAKPSRPPQRDDQDKSHEEAAQETQGAQDPGAGRAMRMRRAPSEPQPDQVAPRPVPRWSVWDMEHFAPPSSPPPPHVPLLPDHLSFTESSVLLPPAQLPDCPSPTLEIKARGPAAPVDPPSPSPPRLHCFAPVQLSPVTEVDSIFTASRPPSRSHARSRAETTPLPPLPRAPSIPRTVTPDASLATSQHYPSRPASDAITTKGQVLAKASAQARGTPRWRPSGMGWLNTVYAEEAEEPALGRSATDVSSIALATTPPASLATMSDYLSSSPQSYVVGSSPGTSHHANARLSSGSQSSAGSASLLSSSVTTNDGPLTPPEHGQSHVPTLPTTPTPPSSGRRRSFFTAKRNSKRSPPASIGDGASGISELSKGLRKQAEMDLGTRLLRAAGASEEEVRLRCRAVGHAELKRLEELERERGKQGNAYAGGAPLVSMFTD